MISDKIEKPSDLKNLTIEEKKELQKVDGIGPKLAHNIKKFADNY